MIRIPALLLVAASIPALAVAEPSALPPDAAVARALRTNPSVLAASSQMQVEEANRRRLEAGSHEWTLRLAGQQRRTYPPVGGNERYGEWGTALERPLRLPGKATLDAELGARSVSLAEAAYGDALHEASRGLLKAWFAWLRESAAAAQWKSQVALLEKQSATIRRRQQLGDAARIESVQSEAALAQAESQLAQAMARQRTAREDLQRRYPGLPESGPEPMPQPLPITGDEDEWTGSIAEHSHELAIALREAERAQLASDRSRAERLPDPTFGVHLASERSGEEHIVGAFVSIPLPGEARRAASDAAAANATAVARRADAVRQKIGAEAASLYHAATAGWSSWQAGQKAADRLVSAADMLARAYQLGEGSLNDLLAARRLANDAQLSARMAQLDALELRYRLMLDAHQIWEFD
ncbi:MAG: TolC family protein [Betaproteobacteria bacterium]|nr:TolC family protein [Betaproteobacteria bacterium]